LPGRGKRAKRALVLGEGNAEGGGRNRSRAQSRGEPHLERKELFHLLGGGKRRGETGEPRKDEDPRISVKKKKKNLVPRSLAEKEASEKEGSPPASKEKRDRARS